MTTLNTPSCILESMAKIGLQAHHPITREQAIARMKEAVAACERHKTAATVKALELVSERRRHESKA